MEGASLHTTLDSLGYPQPTTDILGDNMCTVGLAVPDTLCSVGREVGTSE